MEIMLTERGGEHYADSRMIADALGVEHDSVQKLLNIYEFGVIRFEIGKPGPAGGRPAKTALLSERQALFLLTLVQNTERAREAKLKLVDAFLSLRAAKNPASLSRLEILNMAIQSETERLRLEAENNELRPKALAAEELLESHGNQSMRIVAQALGTGRNRLFEFLREEKILDDRNIPYQTYVEQGYFSVRIKVISNGENKSVTLVTPRGMVWLANKYRSAS